MAGRINNKGELKSHSLVGSYDLTITKPSNICHLVLDGYNWQCVMTK